LSWADRDSSAWYLTALGEHTAIVSTRLPRLLAVGGAAGAAGLSAAGIVLAALIPGYFRTYIDAHLLVNAVIGIAYSAIGACIAWARPRNPIGWLFILQGWCGGGLTAIGEPYGVLALSGHQLPLAAWVAWAGGWSWSVAFLLGPTVLLTIWPAGKGAWQAALAGRSLRAARRGRGDHRGAVA
jgi:hypothetical protein